MSMGASKSSSSSNSVPQDMTPPEIAALRSPAAQVFGSLLGFDPAKLMQHAETLPAGGGKTVPFSGGPVLQSHGNWQPDVSVAGAGGTAGGATDPIMAAIMASMGGDGQPFNFGQVPLPNTAGGSLGNDVLAGIPGWTGPLVAGMAPGEQFMLNQLTQNQTGNRTPLLEDTLAGKFLPGQNGANPFLQAAIEAAQRPTFQALEETLGRTLPGRFNLAGQTVAPQGSSAFDRHAAMAARDASQNAGDIAAKMSAGAYEAERGRQMEAIKLSQSEVDTVIKNLQAQALPRLIQDLGIERGMEEFRVRVQSLIQVLGAITQTPMQSLGQKSSSQSKSSSFSFGLPMGG